MVDFDINVRLNTGQTTRQGRRVERQLERIARQGRRLQNTLNAAFAFTGLTLGIREIIQLADSFTNIQSRLRVTSDETQNLTALTEDLFTVANRTRVSFDTTATVYNRLAFQADELGLSQDQLLRITEQLNQAVIVSGATAQEARNGLIQFSQGIASGALRGDELRAVLEQLPVVAQTLARGLDTNVGSLRQLGAEGFLTSERIVEAFEKAGGTLDEQFAQTIPTIEQGFTRLGNSALRAIGIIGEDRTGSRSSFLVGLADSIDTATDSLNRFLIVATAGIDGGLDGIAQALQDSALGKLDTSEAETQVENVNRRLAETRRQIQALESGLSGGTLAQLSLGGLEAEELQKTNRQLDNLNRRAESLFAQLEGLNAEVDEDTLFRRTARERIDALDKETDILRKRGDERVKAQEILKETIRLEKELNSLTSTERENLDAAIDRRLQAERFAEVQDRLITQQDEFQRLANAGQEAFAENVINAEQLSRFLEGLNEEFQVGPQIDPDFDPNALSNIDLEIEGLQETNLELEKFIEQGPIAAEVQRIITAADEAATPAQAKKLAELIRENAIRREQAEIADQAIGRNQAFLITQEALNRELERGAISWSQYRDGILAARLAADDYANTAGGGVSRGLDRIEQQIRDVSGAAETALVNAFNNAEDAIVEFVQTGKFEFSDFVNSLSADLTRLITRQLLTAALGSGEEGSGLVGLLGNLLGGGKADGGPVSAGRPVVVGERGPEIFNPDTSGQVISNQASQAFAQGAAQGGGGQGATQVNVEQPPITIVNTISDQDIADSIGTEAGERVIMNILQRNRRNIRNLLG